MRKKLIIILLLTLVLSACNLPDEARPDLSFLNVLAVTATAPGADVGQPTPTPLNGDGSAPEQVTATALTPLDGAQAAEASLVPTHTAPPLDGATTETPTATPTVTVASGDPVQEPTYTPPSLNASNTPAANATSTNASVVKPTSTPGVAKAVASDTPVHKNPTNTTVSKNPTNTPVQPTNTKPAPPTATNTQPPPPTNTPVPPTPVPVSQSCSPSGNGSFESQLVNLINQERTSRGLGTLSSNSQLTTAARNHSEDMACNDFFSHTGSNGSSPWDRIAAAGYSGGALAENIAAGQGSAQQVFDGWMNSTGHRDNMLNPAFVHVGVGYKYSDTSSYGSYITATFGSP